MKKGLSPVITVIMLISLVVGIGIIVFPWLKGITGQAMTLEGKNIALVCEDVKFRTSYSNEKLYISNLGNINIPKIKALVFEGGSYQTIDTNEFLDNWPTDGLNKGEAFSSPANFNPNAKEIKIIPVLIGKTESGKEYQYTCGERFGEIILD